MFEIIKELKFKYNLYYYKLFYPNEMNIYNIINNANKLKKIGVVHNSKYSCAITMFSVEQEILHKKIISSMNYLCNSNKYKNSNMCSQNFRDYYITKDYHIANNIDGVTDSINSLCKLEEYKNSNMCSQNFRDYYIVKDYHITDDIDGFIERIKSDIIKNNLNY